MLRSSAESATEWPCVHKVLNVSLGSSVARVQRTGSSILRQELCNTNPRNPYDPELMGKHLWTPTKQAVALRISGM